MISLIILFGCAPAPQTGEVIPMNSPAPIISPTSTAIKLETPNPTETIPPTATVDHSLERCLSIVAGNNMDFDSHGYLVFSKVVDIGGGKITHKAYKLDMTTNGILEISQKGENILEMSVSPDGKWMAYESYVSSTGTDYLVVADSSEKQRKKILWKKEWNYIADWLDNENILFGTTSTSDQTNGKISSTFIVYNPFTDKSKILEPNFPDIYENHSIAANWSGWRETVYNQKLNHVVYLQGGPGGDGPFHYVLRDIQRKLNLVSFTVIVSTDTIPRWLPNGTEFAVALSIKNDIYQTWPAYELYRVSEDGQVTQMTHITDYYPWVYVEDYSWSPDGKYIAFWFSWWSGESPDFDLQGNRYLAVVDTENNDVTNFCIQGRFGDNGRVPTPVWSPDGKQLAIESVSPEGKSRVVVIDLAQQIAAQIGEDMTPIGWMK